MRAGGESKFSLEREAKGTDKKIGWALGLALLLQMTSCLKYEKVELRPELIPGASYVGMSECEACHDLEVESFRRSSHAQLLVDQEIRGQACEFCHGPGSLHAEDEEVKGLIINPVRNAEPCFRCHLDKRARFNLQSIHPVAGGRVKGRVGCSDCHRLHGSESAAASVAEGPNERCFRCHREQRGPAVWEHDAVREGCTSCHDPHGSINDKLLVMPPEPLCLRCHWEASFSQSARMGGWSHRTNFLGKGERCIDCHREGFHGSNFRRGLSVP